MALDQLPLALLHTILFKLDVQSICAVSASNRTLHSCGSLVLQNLHRICLVDIPLRSGELEKLVSANCNLRSLTLDCRKLHDKNIAFLLKPHLEELCLWKCGKCSYEFLREIGLRCPNLRLLSLELTASEDWQGVVTYRAALEQMLNSLCHLESLSISMEEGEFVEAVFGTLPKFVGPSLKALAIGCMREENARQLVNVSWTTQTASIPRVRVVGGQNLEKICLVVTTITDHLMSTLMQNLVSLSLLDLEDNPAETPSSTHDLSNRGIGQIAAYTKLKRLSLVRGKGRSNVSFKRVNDLGFLLLAQCCTGLESIRLGGFSQVTDTGLNSLLHSCSNLHTFDLVHMRQTSDLTFHDMSATTLSLVAASLTAATKITSDAVVQLACCKNLKYLNLAGCRSVGDHGLKAISSLSELTILCLNGADITDFGLLSLGKGSTPLVSLSLHGCKRLTDRGITTLMQGFLPFTLRALNVSNIPALTDHTVFALVASGMQIVDLRLRDCHRLTQACVVALASMQDTGRCCGGFLTVLDLWNNKGITANSLQWFKKPYFPRLRWLGLGWHVKNEATETLVQERPSVEISWEGGEPDSGFGWNGSQKEIGCLGFGLDNLGH